jgi:hypothetical protein
MSVVDISSLTETVCSCKVCKSMCILPCWPTPDEAALIMDKHPDKLMEDYWSGPTHNIYVLCPANPGWEGRRADWSRRHGCIMQDRAGLCTLHNTGFKPLEARVASCTSKNLSIRESLAQLWDTEWGRFVVAYWRVSAAG